LLLRLCYALRERSRHRRLNRRKREGFIAQDLEKNPDAWTERSWKIPVFHHRSLRHGSWPHFWYVGQYAARQEKTHHEMQCFFVTTEGWPPNTPFVVDDICCGGTVLGRKVNFVQHFQSGGETTKIEGFGIASVTASLEVESA
jgi:hypothetical protein